MAGIRVFIRCVTTFNYLTFPPGYRYNINSSAMDLQPWIERTFDTGLPPGRYPALLERLQGTPARLEQKLKAADISALTRIPPPGNWSVPEHTGHLIDLENLLQQRLQDFEDGKDTLTAADMSNRATNEAGYNRQNPYDLLEQFTMARMNSVTRLRGYPADMVHRSAFHPRLKKPMNLCDLVFFFAEHDDHHLAIIDSLLAK